MSIEGISALNGLLKSTGPKVEKRDGKAGASSKSQGTEAKSGDSVQVSSGAVDESFKAKLEMVPDMRSGKIEELQKDIADGNYKVPSEEIADIILSELL